MGLRLDKERVRLSSRINGMEEDGRYCLVSEK